jgi:2'-5' RNA ligase
MRRPFSAIQDTLAHAGRRIRWRPQRFEVGYVILLNDEVTNYVRRLQIDLLREHGPCPSLHVAPHITLKQAFPVPALEPFERYFEQLINETEPFEIVVRGFGSFDRDILFLDVVQNSHLVELRKRILRGLSVEFGIQPYPLEDDRYM